MSHSGKPISEMGFDSLADRLRNSLLSSCNINEEKEEEKNDNKPDFRELDLGSPVSPLMTRTSRLSTSTTTTTTTSSGSSSSYGSGSGRNVLCSGPTRSDASHSGELSGSGSVESSPTARGLKPGQGRSDSGNAHPLIYSGGCSVTSPVGNALPAGNICPSGKILKTGMACKSTKTDVLGTGTANYGHGSIMRGGVGPKFAIDGGSGHTMHSRGFTIGETVKRGIFTNDSDELKRIGNENYKKGNFIEALSIYDKAIAISPGNAALHYNRAAALMALNPLGEAVKECEEAIRLDPSYVRAHQLLGSLLLSLGQVENARSHFFSLGHKPDQAELQKLQAVEKHISKCTDARRGRDWKSTLREAEAATASGADACPQLFACRAEAYLKLHKLEDAELCLSKTNTFEPSAVACQSKFFGMLSEAYIFFVQAQIEMARGRFENALTSVKRAAQVDPRSTEVSALLNNVRLAGQARGRGNNLFKSERYTEACAAYGEGLMRGSSNSVLYCNRAACWYKLGQWEKSLDDCNQALIIQPNYTKALLRRAASNAKLERWEEAVRDYEVLRRELPYENEVAESLFHAQVALKKSRGEDVYNMKFGGEVELVSGLQQFRAAISSSGASVVHFKAASNLQCKQISPFLDTLSTKFPSISFLKVDVEESPTIATAENIRIVPTFKIYKNGSRVKEMVCPSPEVLESSVRHYII